MRTVALCYVRTMRCYFACGTTNQVVHAMFVMLLKWRDGWFSSVFRIRCTRFLSSANALTNYGRCFLKNVQAIIFFFGVMLDFYYYFLQFLLLRKCAARSSSFSFLSFLRFSSISIFVSFTFLIPLLASAAFKFSDGLSCRCIYRTNFLFPNKQRESHVRPGLRKSLYNSGKLNSMRQFRQYDGLSA